jgi:signal transduction histidine kinase
MGGEVERMETILKDYLSFSRPVQSLQPRVVRLGALADDVLSAIEGRAESGRVELRRRGDAAVEADTRKLKDALFNLLGNALEATPAGGTVEVQIEQTAENVRIAVRDSGCGMPKEVLERLGTPFFTTREEGTGLGVAIARATFTQHGGSLVYASEPGRGTTAVGTLPLRNGNGSSHAAGPVG